MLSKNTFAKMFVANVCQQGSFFGNFCVMTITRAKFTGNFGHFCGLFDGEILRYVFLLKCEECPNQYLWLRSAKGTHTVHFDTCTNIESTVWYITQLLVLLQPIQTYLNLKGSTDTILYLTNSQPVYVSTKVQLNKNKLLKNA